MWKVDVKLRYGKARGKKEKKTTNKLLNSHLGNTAPSLVHETLTIRIYVLWKVEHRGPLNHTHRHAAKVLL